MSLIRPLLSLISLQTLPWTVLFEFLNFCHLSRAPAWNTYWTKTHPTVILDFILLVAPLRNVLVGSWFFVNLFFLIGFDAIDVVNEWDAFFEAQPNLYMTLLLCSINRGLLCICILLLDECQMVVFWVRAGRIDYLVEIFGDCMGFFLVSWIFCLNLMFWFYWELMFFIRCQSCSFLCCWMLLILSTL